MEVLLEKSSATNATLKVSLSKEDYQPKVDKALKDYSKKITLKGFRPGKVPPQVVKKMYGKNILIDEVNQTVATGINDYIRENKLQVVGDPSIDREKAAQIDWDNADSFDFDYELGLASDFEVNWTALPPVTSYTILAGGKELDETIENLKERFTEQTNVEVSEAGDMIFGEIKEVNGAFSTKSAIPFKQLKEEAQAKFIGLTKESTVLFNIREDFTDEKALELLTSLKGEEAANLTSEFELKVDDISRNAPAEINQALFDKVLGMGKADNEEDFKTQLLEIVQGNYGREAAGLLRRDTEQALLDNIVIDLPNDFLKKWLFEANEGKFTMEQIETDYEAFTKSMKFSLIKNKIAESADIKVTYEEVLAQTEDMVRQQFGFYGNEMGDTMNDTIKRIASNYLDDEKGENYRKSANQVFDDKLYEYIKTQIQTTSKDIDVEQFKEIVKALPV